MVYLFCHTIFVRCRLFRWGTVGTLPEAVRIDCGRWLPRAFRGYLPSSHSPAVLFSLFTFSGSGGERRILCCLGERGCFLFLFLLSLLSSLSSPPLSFSRSPSFCPERQLIPASSLSDGDGDGGAEQQQLRQRRVEKRDKRKSGSAIFREPSVLRGPFGTWDLRLGLDHLIRGLKKKDSTKKTVKFDCFLCPLLH